MSLQSRLTSLAQAIGADIKSLRSSVAAAYLPVGTLLPWRLSESTIPGGWIADYGQLLNRADYPDLWARVAPSAVTDAVWLAAPYLERAKFSSGNGTTTFRMPDTNAKHPDGNTPAAAVLRGNGRNSAGTPGLFQLDQLGPMTYVNSTSTSTTNVYTSNIALAGAVLPRIASVGQATPVGAATNGTEWVTNTGDETRVVSATVIWCTVGAAVASNPGSVDVVALASTVATQASKIQTLEAQGSLGVGQVHKDLTASKALNTVYTNSSTRTIYIHVSITGSLAACRAAATVSLGGETITLYGSGIGTSGVSSCISIPIPPGAAYSVAISTGVANSFTWAELRA